MQRAGYVLWRALVVRGFTLSKTNCITNTDLPIRYSDISSLADLVFTKDALGGLKKNDSVTDREDGLDVVDVQWLAQ